jgi:aspartyl/asparaginyl-tRNA synthetase
MLFVVRLSTGCSVEVTGVLQSSQGKGQSKEILASGVKLVGPVDEVRYSFSQIIALHSRLIR